MDTMLIAYLTILLIILTVVTCFLHHEIKRIDDIASRLEANLSQNNYDEFDLFS